VVVVVTNDAMGHVDVGVFDALLVPERKDLEMFKSI